MTHEQKEKYLRIMSQLNALEAELRSYDDRDTLDSAFLSAVETYLRGGIISDLRPFAIILHHDLKWFKIPDGEQILAELLKVKEGA